MKKSALLTCAAILSASASINAALPYNAPGALNPIIPGYFADPTVKQFGDTYYIYATTDGSGAGFGPAQLWASKDFVNWTLMPMNWPDSHWIWAPDVMHNDNDGKYYLVYCQPCNLYCGSSETPRGPWQNILGESEAVLVPDRFVTNAITLDGQTFVDDDGSIYMYWGTWGIYKGFGCGSGKLAPDMKSFSETRLIPNTEATDFFEAPFVFKRNGIYYFMYSSDSCHDRTYHVQYATSDKPLGPYTYRGSILETNEDETVHGPGHHSILKQGEDYYIVYHRHDNPHSNRGFHRQLCIDKMTFAADGTINKVTPTHEGVGALAPTTLKSANLAFNRPVKASSFYDNDFKPSYAVDDNNGTLWRPATMGQEWLEIDLEKVLNIKTIWTQWEYGTQFYQYLIETSRDGKTWEIFADKRANRLAGSPMVDFGNKKARYVRITFTGGQKCGFPGAIWNVKVFPEIEDSCPQQWIGATAADWDGRQWNNNEGQLAGHFVLNNGMVTTQRIGGKDALVLAPNTTLTFSSAVISAKNKHTISAITYANNQWQALNLDDAVSDGNIIISSGNKPLYITNLRYYNWVQEPAEKAYDVATDIRRNPVADTNHNGLIVNIDADVFNDNDTVPYIPNHGLEGYFEAEKEPVIVKTIDGRKALEFTGTQSFISSFPLPATLRDNAPYTLEAWYLNPEIAENECLADFTSTHDELEKIMLVNGTEPRCGVMQHYGWYEDAGWKDVAQLAGKWQHLYVCFDGRIESVYLNDNLVSHKDIQLLIKPSQYITLGRNAEREWFFTGYIRSIKLWDEYIPYNANSK
jgi:beta-xylosidase